MKRLLICVLLLASLTACAAPSGPGAFRCDEEEKACVRLTVAEPIKPGQPVSVTITVTSEKDIRGLMVSLVSYPPGKVSIDEEPGLPSPKGGEVDWTADVQAKHPLTVTRKIRLPSVEGEYGGYALIDLQAWIHVAGGMVVDDGLMIYVTSQGGKVYYSGTPIPIPGWTPGQPAPAVPVTPRPSPTFTPTPTLFLYPNPPPDLYPNP